MRNKYISVTMPEITQVPKHKCTVKAVCAHLSHKNTQEIQTSNGFPFLAQPSYHTAGTPVHTQAALQHTDRLFLIFFLFLLLLLMLYTSTFLFVDQEYTTPQALQVKFCRNLLSSFPKISSHTTLFWGSSPD